MPHISKASVGHQVEMVILGNGRKVSIRPISRSDGQLEKELIEDLSVATDLLAVTVKPVNT